ncbi:MAG TPA: hypothetical protein VMZ91_11500 [Candidatus Paceibacterota bacterium]|nr:hypothetical protein [Candidatus Paceibacterota bacterium]
MPGPIFSYGYLAVWQEEDRRRQKAIAEKRECEEAELQDKDIGRIMQRIQQEEQRLYQEQKQLEDRRHLVRHVIHNIMELKKLSDYECRLINIMANHPLYPLAPEEGLTPRKADKSKFEHPIEKRLEDAIIYYEKSRGKLTFFRRREIFSRKEQWASCYYLKDLVNRLRRRAMSKSEYEELMTLPFRRLFKEAYSKLSPKLKRDIDTRDTTFSPWDSDIRDYRH